jgi:hypothetical protein
LTQEDITIVLDEPLITGALFFVVENQVELSMICVVRLQGCV